MPLVRIQDRTFDVDAIVFDKDGTLIDLHVMWATLARHWIDAVAADLPESAVVRAAMDRTLGLDRSRGRVIPGSPLAVGTIQQAATTLAVVLYQHATEWTTAERWVAGAMPRLDTLPAELIRPLGDVAGAMRALTAAGLRLAIATSDNRRTTLAMLDRLGIAEQIAVITCGDDPPPHKPDGAVVTQIATALGVSADRLLMVGDSVGDMVTGRHGRVAGCVGIASEELGQNVALAMVSDVIIATIDEIQPL